MSEQENRPQGGQQAQGSPAGGNRNRNRHRRGRGGKNHHRPSNAPETAGTENIAKSETTPPPANNGGQGGGNRSRHRHRRGRGKGHSAEVRVPQQQPTPQSEVTAPAVSGHIAEPITPAAAFVPPTTLGTAPTLRLSSFDGEDTVVSEETLAIIEKAPIIGGKTIAPEDAVTVVGIRFREHGKIYYFDPNGLDLSRDIHVIVETANGDSYGFVATIPHIIDKQDLTAPLRPVLRLATEEERQAQKQNRRMEVDAYNACVEKIARHGLAMKLIDVECPFDRSKLLFFFTTPEERVDFRELVKDLAGTFRIRIEMRQIGIRDEARKLGGLGICGRPFCCSTFLSNFAQVTIKMAKEQNLALNAAKISGACGRLMCCLRYEHEVYEAEMRLTPKVDSIVATPDGNAIVIESSPLAGLVKVKFLDRQDQAPKQFLRDDVRVIGSKKKGITADAAAPTEDAPKE